MALCAGCDAPVDESGETSESYVCSTVGATWWNQSFAQQNGRFHFYFYATPSAGNIDGVIGLSSGSATTWSKLAAIVRFNPDGYIDARSAGVYRADVPFRYTANLRYLIDVAVDVTTHKYTVTVDDTRNQIVIARDYPFRTEQAGVTSLNNIAAFTNPETGPGSISLCEPQISSVPPPPPACITPMAGEGFFNVAIEPSNTVQLVSLTAIAGRDGMDGVIGVTNGAADDYNDFATSIRFWTSGYLEARDADTYRADAQVPYRVGQRIDLRFIIDVPSKTYSVFARSDDTYEFIELARGYRFRTQQATAPKLDNVAMVVASDLGGLSRCEVRGGPHSPMIAVRDGIWDVHPLAAGSALISDGAKTVLLDAGNVPRATLAAGGKITADNAGNVYVATNTNGLITVRSFTSAFAPRWTTSLQTRAGAIGDIVVTNAGQIAVSLGYAGDGTRLFPSQVARFDSAGRYLSTVTLADGASAISLSPNHFAVTQPVSGAVEVQVWSYDGALVRTRQFAGDLDVTHVAIATDDTLVFGGTFYGQSQTFDSCTVEPFSNSEVWWHTFVTSLRSDLGTRFCERLTNDIGGISTIGSQIAVAYQTLTQMRYVDTLVFDADGNILRSTSEDAFLGYFGRPGSVWLGPNGRMYLNEEVSLGSPVETPSAFLITLAP